MAQFGGSWARFSIDFEGFLGPRAGVELGLLGLLHIMLSWLLDARFMGLGVIFRGSGIILEEPQQRQNDWRAFWRGFTGKPLSESGFCRPSPWETTFEKGFLQSPPQVLPKASEIR